MRAIDSWYEKADAFAEAWFQVFRMHPVKGTVVLGLCVAEHETRCGDAWPGSHNWGAATRRSLTEAERVALRAAGVRPVLNPASAREASETAAMAALGKAQIDPGSDVTLHVDSLPKLTGNEPYFTWFAKEPDDIAGARYFIKILSRTADEKAALAGTSTYAIANAMFHAGYYTGFHHDDPEANIRDYANSLAMLVPVIAGALVTWVPGADPPQPAPYVTPDKFDLSSVLGVQQALNYLHPAGAQLVEDGKMGPKTRAAIIAFQLAHALTADGIVGPLTVAAIRLALAP